MKTLSEISKEGRKEINLNELQEESLEKLKQACKGAHFINVVVRKNGQDLIFQIDYLPKLLSLLSNKEI